MTHANGVANVHTGVLVLNIMVVDRGNLMGTKGFNCSLSVSARCDATQYKKARS